MYWQSKHKQRSDDQVDGFLKFHFYSLK